MTVKEVAAYLKLSEVMVYKLAQKGEMPASKIGSAWRFAQSEIDAWLLGQREGQSWLADPANAVMDRFITGCQKEFGDNLGTIVIFGSYARGDADKDSDLDVLVTLVSIEDYWKEEKKIEDVAYESTFGNDVSLILTSILMTEEEYLTGNSPLLTNIRREGKKAA